MDKKLSSLLFSSLLVLTVSACSGGGSDDSAAEEPANQKPTANAGQDQTADEQTNITLEGSGTDRDGSISSYSWAQVSGSTVELTDADTANLSFSTPVAKTEVTLEFELTVTDNDGATDKDSVVVVVRPVDEQKVTLQGVVTDEPIANAQVTAEVAGRTYTTTADESGNYTLEIGADEDEDLAELLVLLTADGVGEQEHVKLRSVVDSFANILAQAGDDETLTADENIGVNVTHFSTAIVGLIAIEKGENYLTDKSSFETALPALSGGGVWEIATAIKLIVDYSSQYPALGLPEGIENVWAFASNKNAVKTYLRSIPDEHEALYEEVKNSAYDESSLFEQKISTPQQYIEVNSKFATSNILEFGESGDGNMKYRAIEQSLSTNNAVDKIQIVLEGKVLSTGAVFKNYMGTEYQVQQDVIWESIEVKLIKSSEFADLVALKINGVYQYGTGPFYDFEDEPFTKYEVKLFAKKALPITSEDLIGVRMLPVFTPSLDPNEQLDLPDPYGQYPQFVSTEATVMEFFENGTVQSISGNFGNGSWSITNQGEVELYLDNANLRVKKLSKNLWAADAYDLSGASLGFAAGVSSPKGEEQLDEGSVLGNYAIDGLIAGTSDTYYWFEVQEGGIGYQFQGNDSNNNGVLELNEYYKIKFFWEIVDGKLQLNIYRNLSNDVCTTITNECFVHLRRTFDMFEKSGDKQFVTYQYQMNMLPTSFNDLSPELQDLWVYNMIYTRYLIKSAEHPIQIEVE